MTLWVDSKYLFGNANWLALQSWPKLGCLLLLRLHLAGLTRLLAVYLSVPLLQNTTLTDATLTMDRTKTVPKCMPDSICYCSVGWVALTFQESHRTYALMRNPTQTSGAPPMRSLKPKWTGPPKRAGHDKNKQRIQKSSQTLLFRSGKTARAPTAKAFCIVWEPVADKRLNKWKLGKPFFELPRIRNSIVHFFSYIWRWTVNLSWTQDCAIASGVFAFLSNCLFLGKANMLRTIYSASVHWLSWLFSNAKKRLQLAVFVASLLLLSN